MSIYSVDWMITGAYRSRLQMNCGLCLSTWNTVLGFEGGPRSHVDSKHCILATFYTASGYFLAIYLSQTIWSSVLSVSLRIPSKKYIMRFIPQIGSGRPKTWCPEVEPWSLSFSLPKKLILRTSPETRLLD